MIQDPNQSRLLTTVVCLIQAKWGTPKNMFNGRVAVVGATGAVGQEVIRLLERPESPFTEIIPLASQRSAGKFLRFRHQELTVQELTDSSFRGVDFAIFSAGSSISQKNIPDLLTQNIHIVDNSSAFRTRADVPLVIPEINWNSIRSESRLIANPNCTAAISLMAMAPLHRKYPLSRVIMSTYQSASGAGAMAMAELEAGTRAYLEGEPFTPQIFQHPYAFNLFSHNTPIGSDGFNGEETKVVQECRKILDFPGLAMCVTCVRVPVLRSHSISLVLEFEDQAPSEDEARQILSESSGVKVVDDRAANHFPMPSDSNGDVNVLVGRIRQDPSHPRSLAMFVCGDQLLKGAAWNAVQITERLAVERGGR